MDETLEAQVQQAVDRSGHHIRGIQSYIDMRRDSGGVYTMFAHLELGLDIPDEVMSHPAIKDMAMACNDMICFINVSNFSADTAPVILINA